MKTAYLFLCFSLFSLASTPGRGADVVSASTTTWLSIEGKSAQVDDIIRVRLRDLRPTQPLLGFDRIYYKLARYADDRRKIFDQYCEKNGQDGIRDFLADSDLRNSKTFACLEPVGTVRAAMKTVVIAPDGKLYLTDGHHTFNAFWEIPEGGPDLFFNVIVSRDYRRLASMDDFWKQMQAEGNIWLFDVNDKPITQEDLPKSLGIKNFVNDKYRALMYFTRRIAWRSPAEMNAPDAKFYDDDYPEVPFVEFYWMREIRGKVNLKDDDLNTRKGYLTAIRAVGQAIMEVKSSNLGGSGKSAAEMGQFSYFNENEFARISRPHKGKVSYMLRYKESHAVRKTRD